MLKIGILTFHDTTNYGAMLQAYGLYAHLSSLGHDVWLIRHPLIHKSMVKRKTSLVQSIKAVAFRMLTSQKRRLRNERFEQFIANHLRLADYDDSFDLVLIGSDQVWNFSIIGSDTYYLGDSFNCKLASYAASCGNIQSMSAEHLNQLTSALKRFAFISVREAKTQKVIQPLVNTTVKLVLDPTLMIDNQYFQDIQSSLMPKYPYVLLYDRTSREVYDFAVCIAKQLKAKVITLRLGVDLRYDPYTLPCASVEDFLALISHAACIVTTSFHGCALSLSYQKDFYAMDSRSAIGSRISELLEALDLTERNVVPTSNQRYEPIDYRRVTPKLEAMRKDSIQYLKEATL